MLTRLVLVALTAGALIASASDDGIGIDPNGRRAGTATIDHRCTIDPNGSPCIGGQSLDRGAGLDPNG